MITVSVDVTKIDKAHLFHGKKGIYLNLILVEKANEYGDTGFCAQSLGKEKRGPILGNWRDLSKANGQSKTPPPKPKPTPPPRPEDDDIPF